MKAIHVGNIFKIFNDTLETYDSLPPQVYSIRFSKIDGFFLEVHPNLEVNETKVYGAHTRKIEKVLKTFSRIERNLGVILSGDKGIGKSLFSRMLSEEVIKNDIPVIIVDTYYPGIANYIAQIDQTAMFLFDEFDKTFEKTEEADPQVTMLSLFDGIEAGKRLFVITCNKLDKLNDYLVNRTGRFHYHFRFAYPDGEEIREYLTDKLSPEYYSEIDNVIDFARRVDLTYDSLRAIAFELNNGEAFKDAIIDLNILNIDDNNYDVTVRFSNGITGYARLKMDLFDPTERKSGWFKVYNDEDLDVLIDFITNNIEYDYKNGCYFVDNSNILHYHFDDEEKHENLKIDRLEIRKIKDRGYNYLL